MGSENRVGMMASELFTSCGKYVNQVNCGSCCKIFISMDTIVNREYCHTKLKAGTLQLGNLPLFSCYALPAQHIPTMEAKGATECIRLCSQCHNHY